MTKGRSTTWDERIDIVHYCLAHQHDYHKTAGQFQVSYQQVYQWVKKFEAGGADALKDGRGERRPEEMTEADRQKLEMKKMEYEMERLRAENAFLKSYGKSKGGEAKPISPRERLPCIQALQEEESISIQLLCEVAGVARSSYYKWLNRKPSSREQENERLTKMMMSIYEKVEKTLGTAN
ncbi:helix-turn-helix domain-containing protein [Paenibacillus mucilaginosus]|uniref:helix-turn-helix domain-containing protein n=1 Tax=Paenibacillus mucilaginosus TaxID=61624 RepID=UPI00240E6850|nr:helix-turn-helix domain-containing protein [Paenibacillus mucilaginosus]WFA17233.1 helix-turn-helix domain-containing protein [Paenibacillus mucilaginosus]